MQSRAPALSEVAGAIFVERARTGGAIRSTLDLWRNLWRRGAGSISAGA